MCKVLVLVCFVGVAATVHAAPEGADLSHGLQILSKVVRKYLNTQTDDLRIGDGVHLIATGSINDARANVDDGSMLGSIENYLQTHEIRIKLPELMPEEGFGRAFKEAIDGFEDNEVGTARKKNKGGGLGGLMLMGLMMGKMMTALGLGGVGLLAMKALMVSAMALMLSMIIGLKKLVSSDHDDGGGHTVIHANPGGHGGYDHRRKRDAADMAYHAWNEYQNS